MQNNKTKYFKEPKKEKQFKYHDLILVSKMIDLKNKN
jgi:hypothetical protein